MTQMETSRLIPPEHAKLIPVTGAQDNPQMSDAVDVQFNPSSLKVSLSNTLQENQNNSSTRAAQYVDKSSSTLTVELIFDTTYVDAAAPLHYKHGSGPRRRIAEGDDVRLLTKQIADRFLKPRPSGNRVKAPGRCLFQWGAFKFIGLVESCDETLDFFSPEGRPLRATLSLKLAENRFQFRQRGVAQAQRDTPVLSPTGNANTPGSEGPGADDSPAGADDPPPAPEPPSQNAQPITGRTAEEQRNWRDTALYNGIESPRLPGGPVLALPQVSASASAQLDGFAGGKVSLSAKAAAGVDIKGSVGAVGEAISGQAPSPGFRFGASKSLGTGIEGAFNATATAGLTAGGLSSGGARLRGTATVTPSDVHAEAELSLESSVGFD